MITQYSMIWECGVHMVMVTLFTIFQNQNSIKINSNSKCKMFKIVFIFRSKLDFYSQMFNVVSDFGPHCIYKCVCVCVRPIWKRKEKSKKKERNKQTMKCLSIDRWCKTMSYFWPLSLCCILYWRESLILTSCTQLSFDISRSVICQRAHASLHMLEQ